MDLAKKMGSRFGQIWACLCRTFPDFPRFSRIGPNFQQVKILHK